MIDCPDCDDHPYEDAPDIPGWACFQVPGLPDPTLSLEYGFHRPTHLILWNTPKLPPDGPAGPALYPIPYSGLAPYQVPGTWYRLLGKNPTAERRRPGARKPWITPPPTATRLNDGWANIKGGR